MMDKTQSGRKRTLYIADYCLTPLKSNSDVYRGLS